MLKRALDIIFSGFAIIVLSPLFLLLTVLLKITGEGEIFYIQPRVGKNGKHFGLIKFATMLKDSPNMPGGDVTVANDSRVLPFGKILRKTKINELPQLWNIITGDMSFVGPRPFTSRTFAFYPNLIQKEIISVKPGLTGIGSIIFRDEETILAKSDKEKLKCYCEVILPYKGSLEIWYIKNSNLWVDMKIIFLTAWVILFPNSNLYKRIFRSLPELPSDLQGLLFNHSQKDSCANRGIELNK